MLFFLALSTLLVGFVHNSYIPQGVSECMTTASSQKSEAAESSFMESSFQNVEGFANGLGAREYEVNQSEMSQSAQSAQSSFQESRSSNSLGNFANGFTGGLQEFEESMSSTASSFQESMQETSSNTMSSLSNGFNGFNGLQGYESSQTRSESSSSKSASSNYEYSSSSMTSSFDQNLYLSAFEKCKFISEIERQCYLKWLETFSDTSLNYYNNVLDYLTIQEALTNEIVDYSLVQKEILSVQELFASNGIYDVDVDLSTKMAICEKSKSKLKKALKGLSQNSALSELLKYSINEDVSTLPCTIGLYSGIIKNQQTYFEKTSVSQSSSSTRSVASSGASTKSSQVSSQSTIEVTKYESIFKAANVQTSESQLYLSNLKQIASDKTSLFTNIIEFLNQNTQVLTPEMVIDFDALSEEIESLYQLLVKEKFFVQNCDWRSKEAILAELKCKLSNVFKYISKDSFEYQALQYCLEEDLFSVPIFIGVNHYLLQQQRSYFSSSTTVSSSSSRSTCHH